MFMLLPNIILMVLFIGEMIFLPFRPHLLLPELLIG